MASEHRKRSYTIPCSSRFRDQVTALAESRQVNVGDLARSVLLMVPADQIDRAPDPGEPDRDDRETVILKSGKAKGRPWRRKPRLQVRMAPGYEPIFMRKALALALGLAAGATMLHLRDSEAETALKNRASRADALAKDQLRRAKAEAARVLAEKDEEVLRLKTIVSVLSFDPLEPGVTSREDALHVLGFPPGARPDEKTLRARFRILATIHHPDSVMGDHRRMSQLNTAMEILRRAAA